MNHNLKSFLKLCRLETCLESSDSQHNVDCFCQALERDGFGSITPKYSVGSPEVQAQRGIQGTENIVFSRRDVATLTEPTSEVPKVSRPRRQWVKTPDRWEGTHRDHTSSDEEIELLEKERLRNIQEDTGANRRGGKNSSHRCIFHFLFILVALRS